MRRIATAIRLLMWMEIPYINFVYISSFYTQKMCYSSNAFETLLNIFEKLFIQRSSCERVGSSYNTDVSALWQEAER